MGDLWHPRLALATLAFDATTSKTEANRMYAGLTMGHRGDFDGVSNAGFGRRYCDLTEPERREVRDYFWRGVRSPLWRRLAQRRA